MTTAAIQTPAIPAGVTFSHRDILGLTVDCPGISECGRAFTLGMWSATLAHLDDALVRDPDYNYEHHSDPVEIPTQWAPSCVSGMISEGLGWMAEHAAALQVCRPLWSPGSWVCATEGPDRASIRTCHWSGSGSPVCGIRSLLWTGGRSV